LPNLRKADDQSTVEEIAAIAAYKFNIVLNWFKELHTLSSTTRYETPARDNLRRLAPMVGSKPWQEYGCMAAV
jgi:hypothetical protein